MRIAAFIRILRAAFYCFMGFHYNKFALGFEFSPHILIDKNESLFRITIPRSEDGRIFAASVTADGIGGAVEKESTIITLSKILCLAQYIFPIMLNLTKFVEMTSELILSAQQFSTSVLYRLHPVFCILIICLFRASPRLSL